jgi:TPR repeat protein
MRNCARILLVLVAILSATVPAWGGVEPLPHDSLRTEGYIKGLEAYRAGDYKTAVGLWKEEARRGNALAQCNLGACYVQGKGVGQNYNRAVSWFNKSAAQGNDVAQCNLGNCYHKGYGVKHDLQEAVKWYRLAAGQALRTGGG